MIALGPCAPCCDPTRVPGHSICNRAHCQRPVLVCSAHKRSTGGNAQVHRTLPVSRGPGSERSGLQAYWGQWMGVVDCQASTHAGPMLLWGAGRLSSCLAAPATLHTSSTEHRGCYSSAHCQVSTLEPACQLCSPGPHTASQSRHCLLPPRLGAPALVAGETGR